MRAIPETIIELVDLLPPPDHPVHTRGDWNAIEAASGFRFPPDFKEFIARYGSGIIEPVGMWFCNPLWKPVNTASIADLHARATSDHPYVFWPKDGGLYPWGGSNSNHYFFWKTQSNAVSLSIVVSLDCCEYKEFTGISFGEFMVAFLRESLWDTNPILEPMKCDEQHSWSFEPLPTN